GFGSLTFSFDSAWFGFTVMPGAGGPGGGGGRGGRGGRGGEAAPAPAPTRGSPKVVLVKLATGEKTELDGAVAFQFSGEAATHVAYRKGDDSTPAPVGPQ